MKRRYIALGNALAQRRENLQTIQECKQNVQIAERDILNMCLKDRAMHQFLKVDYTRIDRANQALIKEATENLDGS